MENHRSVSIFKAYQKYLQDPCFTKHKISWSHIYLNNNVAVEKDTVLSFVF